MNISDLLANVGKTIKSNRPEILAAFGVAGVATTAYLASKASFKASRLIEKDEAKGGTAGDRNQRIKERTRLVWKEYIPAGISGVTTIACIIGSNRLTGNRTAAAVAAYSLTERAFSEYKEKVVEQIGKGKEEKIRDELVQEKVLKAPSREVIVTSISGHVLCSELYTGRYFRSDMEALRKAQNDINARVIQQVYVTLEEFYEMVGLSCTSDSNKLGWTSDRMMELQFSTVISEAGEPCLAFEYNYVKPLT